ncbi:AAA-16 domain-containing protein [Phanerochaete sordida]|uniref:AAA-16 domain-containing protein n=1 Tax=Phanerochaete sordida TaxID=48140 RepID=A0A9P3G031_9APHY|nr:AAA-16 domain-containing protein [Phanerochaete sordida]
MAIASTYSRLSDRFLPQSARANDDSRSAFIAEAKALDVALKEMVAKASKVIDDSGGDGVIKERLAIAFACSEELQSRIQGLLSTIVELRERATELKGGSGLSGFSKGVLYASRNEAILSEMKEKMASAVEMFKLRGQLSIETILGDIIRSTYDIRQALKEAAEQEVINTISRAPAGYRSVDELKSQFMAGSREELFEEAIPWSAGRFPQRGRKPFYFLSGGAGLGKSSIAHRLCTCLDQPDRPALGASFFFVRGGGDLELTRLFFSTLAHQFALSQPQLRGYIVEAAREFYKRGDRQQMRYTFEELLRDPLRSAEPPERMPIIIVVDGLDECKERDLVRDMLRYLLELVRSLSWVQVFATSRPEPQVMSILTSAAVADIVYHRSLNDTLEKWNDDVRNYLEQTVPRIPSVATFVRQHPSALARLVKRAGGVFIFARIAVNFLDTYQDRPEEQFRLLMSSGGAGVSPLDALYLQVLRSAFPPDELQFAPLRHQRLLALLQYFALSPEDCTLGTIALLLGLLEEDVVMMIDRLRSIFLTNSTGTVIPLHATFREFLLDFRRCTDTLYLVDKAKGSAMLATACSSAFSFRSVTDYLRTHPRSEEIALHAYIFYARSHWDMFLKDAEVTEETKMVVQGMIEAMPVYMRVSKRSGGSEVTSIRDWLKNGGLNTRAIAKICSDFMQAAAYSHAWWDSLQRRPRAAPEVSPYQVERHVSKFVKSEAPEIRRVDTSKDYAAHRKLEKRIQDAGVAELWSRYDSRDRNFTPSISITC